MVKPIDRDAYLIPGGVIDKGETPKQALLRELKEELNLTVKQEDLVDLGLVSDKAVGFSDRTVNMNIFLVKNWEDQSLEYSDGEIEHEFWLNSGNAHTVALGNLLKSSVIPLLIKEKLID